MRSLPQIGLCAIMLCGETFALFPPAAWAQSRNSPAVDAVSLKSGRTLRGAILERQTDGTVSIAVSRTWLEKSDPRDFDSLVQLDRERQYAAWEQAKDRIDKQLAAAAEAPALSFLLKQERERLEKLLTGPAPPELPFIVIDVSAAQVAKVLPAPIESQRIAIFSWNEGLPGVETRNADALRKDLIKKGVDLNGPVPDLSDQVPARLQSEDEWSARMAIVHYTLDEPLDFQGMDDLLLRAGTEEPADLAAILPKLLGKQVDSLLGDLLEFDRKPPQAKTIGDRDGLKSAIDEAEKRERNGFRVTRLAINPDQSRVTVETQFVARLENAGWQTIWKYTETADANKSRPELEARIGDDPQVKTALETMKALGFGADDLVNQALRVGAATMAAQSAADARFFEFRDRYAKRLDSPVLPLPVINGK